MSLIKASYTAHRSKAYAGQIADTSLYNVDGACVAGEKLSVGRLISVLAVQAIEGHKVVQVAKDNALPLLGISVMSHAYSPEGFYEEGIATNVITHGRVWVPIVKAGLVDADVAFDKVVSFNSDGVAAKGGAVKTGYKFTGERLPSDNPLYDLVKIQVLQSIAVPTA